MMMHSATARLRALATNRSAMSAVAVVAALGAMLLLLMVVVSDNLRTIEAAGDSVEHTAQVERAAADLLAAVLDQETGIRGFAESGGDREFLQPFVAGQEAFAEGLLKLFNLTTDNPLQTARLERLRHQMGEWRAIYAGPQLSRPETEAADPQLAQRGRRAMDAVRATLAEVRAVEAQLTNQRQAEREQAFVAARGTVLSVGLLVFAASALLAIWAARASARREREALEYAKAKQRTLAIVSHEIRTPLNGMLGMLQALASETMHPDQKDKLELALESGESLTALLNDLLDASKIEAGRLELVETDFDLHRLMSRTKAAFRDVAREKDVDLRLEVAPEAEGDWIGDKVRIGQIVANLLSNAVKFTDQGSVMVTVKPSPTGGVSIAVRDSGIGMDEATLQRLFAPYVQADAGTAHKYGGTGLGLSISRSLARMMGGDIVVESAPGQGACFTVELPLTRGQHKVEDTDHVVSLMGLRVLAADDNAVNRQVLSAILPSLGIQVTTVEDGDQAVAAWRDGAFDLVLLDLRMPVCDGFEAARRIRAEEEPGRRTPLVLLSGDVSATVREQGRQVGLDGFVAKPLDVHSLIQAITAALPAPQPLAA